MSIQHYDMYKYAAELCYNVMKGTEYFVLLQVL
jgi:hypothetical protein